MCPLYGNLVNISLSLSLTHTHTHTQACTHMILFVLLLVIMVTIYVKQIWVLRNDFVSLDLPYTYNSLNRQVPKSGFSKVKKYALVISKYSSIPLSGYSEKAICLGVYWALTLFSNKVDTLWSLSDYRFTILYIYIYIFVLDRTQNGETSSYLQNLKVTNNSFYNSLFLEP